MLKSRIQGDPVARCPPPVPPPIPRCQRLTKDCKFGYHRLRFATSNTLVSTPSGFNWIGKITALGAARTPLRCPLRRLTVYPTQRPIHPSQRSAALVSCAGCKGSDAPPLVMWPSLSRVHWFKSRGVLKSCRMAALVVLTPQRWV